MSWNGRACSPSLMFTMMLRLGLRVFLPRISRSVPLSQISYMDDIALPLQASCFWRWSPQLLKSWTDISSPTTSVSISSQVRLKQSCNFVVRPRKKLVKSSLPWGALVCSFPMGRCLRVVSGYKHLGVFFSSSGSMAVELSKRVASALGAFHDIVQGFLKARNIAVAPKIQVVMATIVSRLLLYAGVWDPLSAAQVRKLNTVYMRALRAAMGKERGPHLNVTDLAVRIEAGVPSISTLVRRARLRLVARVAATDCDALKALTQILTSSLVISLVRSKEIWCVCMTLTDVFFVALLCDWVGPVVAFLAHWWQVLEEICVCPQVSR